MATLVENAEARATGRVRGTLTLAQLWAFVAVCLPFVVQLLLPLTTVDLAYHIRAGDIMLDTHHVLRTDVFSFTAAGRPWLNQQWGAQVVFASLFRLGGWPLLVVVHAALAAFIFAMVYLACRASGARPKAAAGLTMASLVVAQTGLGLRPQLLAMALFASTVWLVADRHRHPARLWAIPPIVMVWANVHGSFFLPPLLLGLAAIEDRSAHRPLVRRDLGIAGLSVVAANLNPFGFGVWTYVVGISTNPIIRRTVSEWMPATMRDPMGAIFFTSVVAVAVVLARRGRPTPWPTLLTLGTFFAIGLFALRGIFWWAVVAPPAVAALLTRKAEEKLRPDPPSFLNTAFALAFALMAVAILPWWGLVRSTSPQDLLDYSPVKLTSELGQVLRPGDRMFNAQIWGSWFEYALPEHPVFVDARIEVYPAKVWDDYLSVSDGQEGWQDILDRWNVDVVVAYPGQQGGLIPRISRDPGWHLAYRDKDGSIFVRS